MIGMIKNRVALVALIVCLLCAGALKSTRAEENLAKVPTSRYVDNDKHFAMDIPLAWERRFPEDGGPRYLFATGGKSAANAQAPEFALAVTGPDAKDDSLKSLAAFAAAAKKLVAAGASDVKLDKDKELKLDGESALSFDGSKTGKTGPAKFHQVVAVHNGMGYSISLACDPATFDGEWAAAQAVFDSIKWSK